MNNFLGVVAPKEFDAIQAAAQLKVVWNTNPILPGTGNLWKHYRDVDAAGKSPATVNSASKGNVDAALASAAKTVSGTFKHHYQGHMPIGPSCCVADVQADSRDDLEQHPERRELRHRPDERALRRSRRRTSGCIFFEGSGSFGNGCVAFDTAESAAIMSKAVGKPVRLQMMRWDEHGWTHYAPAIMYDMRAGIDANGNIVAYEATGFGQGGTSLYTGRELVGPVGAPNGDGERPADADQRRRRGDGEPVAVDEGLGHQLQGDHRSRSPRRTATSTAVRCAPRAPSRRRSRTRRSCDMLAVAAEHGRRSRSGSRTCNTDLDGQRWAAVLQAAATAAGWKPWVAGSNLSKDNVVKGRGIANSHHGGAYAAAVADIKVNKKSGKITVTHVYAAQDSGFSMNPSLIYNQMIGNVIQGTSRAL